MVNKYTEINYIILDKKYQAYSPVNIFQCCN